jgi:hypothetical protein
MRRTLQCAQNSSPHSVDLAGDIAAMGISANQISDELLTSRISSFLSKLPGLTASEATREMLYIAALRYFDRDIAYEQRLVWVACWHPYSHYLHDPENRMLPAMLQHCAAKPERVWVGTFRDAVGMAVA